VKWWPWYRDEDVIRSREAAERALAEVHQLKPEIAELRRDLAHHQEVNHVRERIERMFRRAV
jgi:hypothetical protein